MRRLITTEAGRTYLYSIGMAVAAILTTYGILDNQAATAWTGLLAAILSGVARAHVGTNGVDKSGLDKHGPMP